MLYLDPRMSHEVEVKVRGVADAPVHNRPWGRVPAAVLLVAVGHEEARVVALLDDHKREARLVALLQAHARLPQGQGHTHRESTSVSISQKRSAGGSLASAKNRRQFPQLQPDSISLWHACHRDRGTLTKLGWGG